MKTPFLVGYMRGLEKIWIIGDTFSNNSFERHYKHAEGPNPNYDKETAHYTFKHYEVREFSSNQYDSFFHNPAGRIRNTFVKAISEHNTLPQLIVVILDDNLYSQQGNKEIEIHDYIHVLTSWLVTEFEKVLLAYKDMLPIRAKREKLPHILWIEPSTHCNFDDMDYELRTHQALCLSEVISTKHDMSMLKIIKIWDHSDRNAFMHKPYRFTADGLARYWSSIDSAIRYWDVLISPKILGKNPKQVGKIQPYGSKPLHYKDKFHWNCFRHFKNHQSGKPYRCF